QDGKDNRPVWTGPKEIAPSMAEMNELIHDHVIVKTLEAITLKNGKSALSIYNHDDCHLHLNTSGKFIIGGPQGDASLTGQTYRTEKSGLTAAAITDIVKLEFDCRPGALAHDLRLREPKYNRTAAYCHFGRDCVEEVGKKFFSWEEPVDLSKYADMDDAGVAQAVADNKEAILKK
ncbi:hypothetical protein ACHAW6_012473, partial [Cyclotella cf. meneghiniana]